MNAIRKEILDAIADIPDSKLEALRPLLHMLADDVLIVETDLSEDEKNIIRQGRKEYLKDQYIPLEQ